MHGGALRAGAGWPPGPGPAATRVPAEDIEDVVARLLTEIRPELQALEGWCGGATGETVVPVRARLDPALQVDASASEPTLDQGATTAIEAASRGRRSSTAWCRRWSGPWRP